MEGNNIIGLSSHFNDKKKAMMDLMAGGNEHIELKNYKVGIVVEMEYKKELRINNVNYNKGDYLFILVPGTEKISHILVVQEVEVDKVKVKVADSFVHPFLIEGIKA